MCSLLLSSSILYLLILLFLALLSNQSNWIMFLISRKISQIFFSSTIFNFMMFVTALFCAPWAQPIMTIFLPLPPANTEQRDLFPFVNFLFCELSSLSQQRCFPTYKPVVDGGRRETEDGENTNFYLWFLSTNLRFSPIFICGKVRVSGFNNASWNEKWTIFQLNKHNKKSFTIHDARTHPNLGIISVPVVGYPHIFVPRKPYVVIVFAPVL